MKLSNVGVIADLMWHQIPQHAQNVELGAFVVMPNHIHVILIILPVEIRHAMSLQNESEKRFQNQGKNTVSSIIGGYKSAVTKITQLFKNKAQDKFIKNSYLVLYIYLFITLIGKINSPQKKRRVKSKKFHEIF